MIDHVSIGVRSLEEAGAFYEAVLAPLGLAPLSRHQDRLGFGKRYPEFWLNVRPNLVVDPDSGAHVSLRAPDAAAVDAFHREALARGGRDEGAPAIRRYARAEVYAAFVRDPDGHRLEAMTITATA